MTTARIRLWIVLVFLYPSSLLKAEIGEFFVDNQVLRELQVTNVERTPFTKKGRRVYPNLTVRLTPTLVDDEDDISLNLNVDLEGTSRSEGSSPVIGSKAVFATVDADVRAHYEQELSYGEKGLQSGKFKGSPQITPRNISVRNNFRLLNRMVQKRARSQAPQQISSELPQERRDLDQKLRTELKQGVDKARDYIQKATIDAQSIISQANNLPFNTKFSSRAGERGGVRVVLTDKEEGTPKTPKPEFKKKDQIAASGIFHQEVLEKTIAQEIAGKEMKIIELKQHLCSEKIRSLIDFCETRTVPTDSLGLSVIFDEKKPVEVSFQNGKVTLKINARNRVGTQYGDSDPSKLLQQASKVPLVSVDSEPYQVEISYFLKDGRAKLDRLEVHERFPQKRKEPKEKKGNHLFSWTGEDVLGEVRRAGGALMHWGTKKALEAEYRRVMKDELEFPTISIPTKLKATPPGSKTPPEILEAGSFVPMEVRAENGWFAVSSQFCTEKMMPLGIFFDPSNRISAVQKGSPAERSGLKAGDRIDSFGMAEERHQPFFDDNKPFLDFVKEHAGAKTYEQRTIEISGRDKNGETFHKTITLCPSKLEHKKEAAKLFYQVKKNPG